MIAQVDDHTCSWNHAYIDILMILQIICHKLCFSQLPRLDNHIFQLMTIVFRLDGDVIDL